MRRSRRRRPATFPSAVAAAPNPASSMFLARAGVVLATFTRAFRSDMLAAGPTTFEAAEFTACANRPTAAAGFPLVAILRAFTPVRGTEIPKKWVSRESRVNS